MRRAGPPLAACLLLVLAAGCAFAPPREDGTREVSIEAEGWAPVQGGDLLSARRRALAEAQKKAVEKAVGVTLRARTRVDDAVSIRQSIVANMGGTIRRYEVASEGADGGFYKVRIRADVLYRPVAPESSRPATPVLTLNIADAKAAGAVRSALSAGDFDFAAEGAPADVAVTGVVETRGLADPRLGGFFSYTAKVSLTAANVRSGKVTQIEYEASAVDVDQDAARDRALETAGYESGTALAGSLAPPELTGAGARASPDGVPPL